jgi:hypothetical protein
VRKLLSSSVLRKKASSFFSDRNETYIYGPDGICESAYSSLGCFTYRGGEYDSKESPGGKVTQERKESDDVNADWFVDTVQLQSNLSIADFAFGVPKQDLDSAYKSQAQLGLGRNASLLNALKMVGIIGSRSFSLSWGQVGGPETQQSRGSLTLGGLDQGLIENKKSATASLNHDSGCRTGMLVTIDDLLLNWPNGTDTSLFMESQSSVVQACIVPSYSGLMTMPFDYWQRFSELAGLRYPQGQETRSMGINFFTMIVGPEGVYVIRFVKFTCSSIPSVKRLILCSQILRRSHYIPTKRRVYTGSKYRAHRSRRVH